MSEWKTGRNMSEQGLRQRKKARTHAGIVEAATKAFLEFGYDNTTLEQVAEAAGVTKRTLLRYFPSKTHLVLGGQHEALEVFRSAAETREGRSILDIWEEHVAVNAQWIAEHGDAKVAQSIATSEPAIIPEMLAIQAEYQALIYAALLDELGSSNLEDQALCAVVAGALIGGNYQIGALFMERGGYAELPAATHKVIDLVRTRLLDGNAVDRG